MESRVENDKALIFIVDDVAKNLQVLGTILKRQNYKIAFATNGKQALENINNISPDLILLDVMMPELDGFEVCKRLKADEKTKDIPVIFLTAKTEIEDVVNGFELGAVDYVTKPFNATELLARVKTHVELKRSREKLQELVATKDMFFSIIAHDLRSPFATISAFISLISKYFGKIPKEEIDELLESLKETSDSTRELLDNLLQWSRSQTGTIQFSPEMVAVGEMIKTNLGLLTETAENKKISLKPRLDFTGEIKIDKDMIDLVIRNLVINALKFTPSGGEITVATQKTDGTVEISVNDTGVGIAPEMIPKLFSVADKISTVGTAGEKGSGLGLILCKEFVEKHSGKLVVESRVGEGSSFRIQLPANGS
ncbi:MAG: response regulator [Actinobacteria bacterium]|nr:response regulator [Actinomycetota bacterium]